MARMTITAAFIPPGDVAYEQGHMIARGDIEAGDGDDSGQNCCLFLMKIDKAMQIATSNMTNAVTCQPRPTIIKSGPKNMAIVMP